MDRTLAAEVVETSSTTGTGTYSLAGAKRAYRTFSAAYPDGNARTAYVVRNADDSKWEENRDALLTYGSPATLTRNVTRSSNGDAAVSWTSDDLPLTVYVPAQADILEGLLRNFENVRNVIDFGGDPSGTDDTAVAIQAAHDDLPSEGGVILIPPGTAWSVRSAVVLTKPCVIRGAGHHLTILNVGSTFAATSGYLFTVHSGELHDLMIRGSLTDPTQAYTGVRITNSGWFVFSNVWVWGCGTGFWFEEGNTGIGINLQVRYFATDGMRFGGTANKYSGEYRFIGGIIFNSNSTGVTNGSTSSGRVIHMADTSAVSVGDEFATYGVPVGTKVASKTSTTLTLDQDVTGIVASGQYVRWAKFLSGTCLHFKHNSFDITFSDLVTGGGRYVMVAEGEPDVPSGLYRPDVIWFNNLNATATTYDGVRITAGTNFRFNHSWIGDVPFGVAFYASASTNDADDVSNIHFNDSLIGGAGLQGAYFDYASNIVFNNSYVVGNSQVAFYTYAAVECTAHASGRFEFVGGHAGNDQVDNSVGASTYGIKLASGSFAGVGDSVNIEAKLSGQTAGLSDASTPVFPLKTINPFGGNGRPAFRAAPSVAQTIGAAAGWTKVTFGTEQFDYGGYFASSRFTPVSGAYQLNATVTLGTAVDWQLSLYKNGSAQATCVVVGGKSAQISDTVISDGDDYWEVYVNIPAGATLEAGQDATFFSGL